MNKQKGFSAVILLLSLLLIVAVGFTGYYVWNSQDNKKENKAEVAQDTDTKQETNQSTTDPTKEEDKYLVIKELGISIPIKDWSYEAKKGELGEYYTIYSNKVKQFAAGECKDKFSFASVSKIDGSPGENDPRPNVEIEGIYYALGYTVPVGCWDEKIQDRIGGLEYNYELDASLKALQDAWPKTTKIN